MERGDLRVPNAPRLARWNWGWLKGCFADTKISASDLDAVWERNGNFLVVEIKRSDEELPYGQQLMLQKLAGAGKFTVCLVRGATRDVPESIQRVNKDGLGPVEPSSQEDFRRRVAAWFARVDGREDFTPEPANPADLNGACRPGCDCDLCQEWPLEDPNPDRSVA